MRQAPAAYTALRAAEQIATEKADSEATRLHTRWESEERAMYVSLCAALEPYNNANLDGHNITIVHADETARAYVYVDTAVWLRLSPERNHSRCACENVCDCERTSWLSLSAIQYRKDGEYHACFPCGDLRDETLFAHAMAKMMDERKYHTRP